SDLTQAPKSLATRTILAKRIIEMADQGLMDVPELRDDALAFLQHNPPFRLIAKGSAENYRNHGSLTHGATGKAVETLAAASRTDLTRRMKRPTPWRACYSPPSRSTYVPHGKAETARPLPSRFRCSLGHQRKRSQEFSRINCVAAPIQLVGREPARFYCSVDRRFA